MEDRGTEFKRWFDQLYELLKKEGIISVNMSDAYSDFKCGMSPEDSFLSFLLDWEWDKVQTIKPSIK